MGNINIGFIYFDGKEYCLPLIYISFYFYFCFELLMNVILFFFNWTRYLSSLISKTPVDQEK